MKSCHGELSSKAGSMWQYHNPQNIFCRSKQLLDLCLADSRIRDFGVLPPLFPSSDFFAVGQLGHWSLVILLCFPSRRGQKWRIYLFIYSFRWPFQLLRCPNILKVMIVLLYLIFFNVSHLFYVKNTELLWLVNGSSKKCYESLCYS